MVPQDKANVLARAAFPVLGADVVPTPMNLMFGDGRGISHRDLVETTVSGDLHPTVKKRLSEVVGLLQVYSRLAKLEIGSGEAPRFPGKGYVALPEDTSERAKEWVEDEVERQKQREAFLGRLKAVGEDPRAALEGMG
jgi:hypothetical protein